MSIGTTSIPCIENPISGRLHLVIEVWDWHNNDEKLTFRNPWIELAELLRGSEKWRVRKDRVVFGIIRQTENDRVFVCLDFCRVISSRARMESDRATSEEVELDLPSNEKIFGNQLGDLHPKPVTRTKWRLMR